MITKRIKNREYGTSSPQAHRGRWRDIARRMAAILTATALGLGITVYGADKYAPIQITDPSQFPTIKIETNLVLDEATELPANVTINGTTYGFVEVGLRVTPGAAPYDKLSYVGVVVSYNNEHLKPITWTERNLLDWTPADDTETVTDPGTGEETTVDAQNFQFLNGEEYLPAKKADIMDTAAARIIGDADEPAGWTAFTMVAACDDEVALAGDSRLMVVRFAYEQTDDFELTYVTEDGDGNPVNQIKRVTGRDPITGAVTTTEDVTLLQWATDDSVSFSPQAENSAMLVGTNDENTVYYAHSDPNPNNWTDGVPDTLGYTVEAVPADGASTVSMLTASAVELPDTVYDTGDDTVYDLTGDTEPETPEEEPEEEELPESEEEEETSFFEELPMLFTSPRAGTAEGSYQTNFFPVDPDYIAGLNDGSIASPWTTMTQIDAPKIQFVDIHRSTADSGVGGISLDDVVPVIFFDWDDTFLGSTVIARGIDSRESVNNFVRDNLIHPDLHTDFRGGDGSDLSRQNSYRGVEPHIDPSNGDTYPDDHPTDPGSKYPLTNKLDYVFYGDPDDVDPYLFDDGWVWVDSALDVQNTWTTLGVGELAYATGDNAGYEAALAKLRLIDFKTDVETISNNTSAVYVKAVYEPGEKLNATTSGGVYATWIGDESSLSYDRYGNQTSYVMRFEYLRKNQYGYGVDRRREPTMQVIYTINGVDVYMEVNVENSDRMAVEVTAAKTVEKIQYLMMDRYNSNFVDGIPSSEQNQWGIFRNYDPAATTEQGSNGFVKSCTLAWLIDLARVKGTTYFNFNVLKDCNFRANKNGTAFTALTANAARTKLEKFLNTMTSNGDTSDPTWYQLQYAILDGGTNYKNAADAYDYCWSEADSGITAAKRWFSTNEGDMP